MKAVLVQGGTFDPVHYGHLQTALDVAELLDVEQIRLIPCGDPAHRPVPGASAEQRLQMLRAATIGQSCFVIDPQEVEREGPSYMVDTAESLRRELGDTTSICLMMGMDAFLGLPSWHRWQELLTLLHLIVVERPGWRRSMCQNVPELKLLLAKHEQASLASIKSSAAGGIVMVAVSALPISATEIRHKISAGEVLEGVLPEAVIELIKQQNIYQNQA